MRSHGSARRSRAIWSRRWVSSFSRASSRLRSATHRSFGTTGWFTVLVSTVAAFIGTPFDRCARGRSRSDPSGTSHGADLAARAAAAIEQVRAVRLEAADAGAGRHLEALEHGAVGRVDATDLADVALP